MKKLLLIVALVSTLLLVACSTAEQTTDKKMADEQTTVESQAMKADDNSAAEMEAETKESIKLTMENQEGAAAKCTAKDHTNCGPACDAKKSDTTEVHNQGEMASNFSLVSLKGDTVALSSLQGQKVYLKFWASWCPVCLDGLEELDQLAASEKDFKVYTIVTPNNGGEKDKEAFKEWFAELGYDNIEVLFDESGDVFKAYQVRALPTSAYIGSDGVIVGKSIGHTGNQQILSKFEEIK